MKSFESAYPSLRITIHSDLIELNRKKLSIEGLLLTYILLVQFIFTVVTVAIASLAHSYFSFSNKIILLDISLIPPDSYSHHNYNFTVRYN